MLIEHLNSRDNNFNLIRFVAASLVLYSHSYALALGSGDLEPLRNIIGMTWGNVSVDVFFTASGFLIAKSFFERENLTIFIWSRILRIYPALVVSTFICTFGVGLIFTTYSVGEYLNDFQTFKFFIKNCILFFGIEYKLPGVFGGLPYSNAVNGSLWTLPYEVKMYVILVIISLFLGYIQGVLVKIKLKECVLLITFSAILCNAFNHEFLWFSPKFLHLFSMFFMGVTAYLYKERIVLSVYFFYFLVLVLVLSAVSLDLFFVIYTGILFYLVLYVAYIPSGFVRKFNNFGDYSYGMYIYAFPVQQSIAELIPGISVFLMVIISFPITLLLAFMSWHYLEKKCMRLKKHHAVFDSVLHSMRSFLK